jgi:MFS family permease
LCAFGQALRAGLVLTIIPLYGTNHLGLSTATVGFAVSALALVDITTMRAGGALADRVGQRRVLTVALLIGAVACAAASTVVVSAWTFATWTALLGVTVAMAWTSPTAIIVNVTDDRELAVGNARVASDIGQLGGSVAAGALVTVAGYDGATAVVAVLLLAVAIWSVGLRELRGAIAA